MAEKFTPAEKMANTEALLEFDSMAKDIVKAKGRDAKLKAMTRMVNRLGSTSKTYDIIDTKAKKQAEKIKKGRPVATKTIKKSRGGMINGNDLVASYYEKG